MPSAARRYWLGVDGEGLGRAPHRYVLLAGASEDGRTWSVEDPNGLATVACLTFLLDLPQNARVAGFYLGYDWTMILRDLPDRAIYLLLRPELRALSGEEGGGFSWIRWRGFRLHYLSGMMRISRRKRSVTVWDIGRFYQCSFVAALEQWGYPAPKEIVTMKNKRDGFRARDFPRIKRYCLEECKLLARLASDLECAHEDAGIAPRSWHGPGSTASAVLTSWGIDEKRGAIPKAVERAADHAYFGGRFEHSLLGRTGETWGHDIASAYPFQAYRLPCLKHGRWSRVTRLRDLAGATQAAVRFRVSDVGSEPWGPLPCRLDSGSIVYPRGGFAGWAWLPEWEAAREGWRGVRFGGEAWRLDTDCDCRPFVGVLDIFRERVRIGKSGRGRVLKLAINSVYGKLAQAVGRPRFASRIWAGMITSGTRAMLLRAIMSASDRNAVYALATDGVYAGERLSLGAPPLAPDMLGSWEVESHGRMVFVRPGIYWSLSDDTLRARGLGRRTLSAQRDAVLAAIDRGAERAVIGETILFGGARSTVYVTPSGALRRSRLYGTWHPVPARISLSPAPKRLPDWSPPLLSGVESRPYGAVPDGPDARSLKSLENLRWGGR